MNYSQSLDYLYSLGHEVLAAKLGLESVRLLLERLGNPERNFRSVIVAGTNGKGSVAAMIEAVARAAGHRTALYTSPHLVRIEERIQVNGEEISENDFSQMATDVRRASEMLVTEGHLESPPTFFEQVTAIALSHFSRSGVELAVLEVGLGGRLDATNVVDPVLSVVTSIDLDHQHILGDTISDIAGEKAAVIKPGAPAVIGRQRFEAASEVLMRRCLQTRVLPVFANEPQNVGANDGGRMSFDYESTLTNYSRIMLGMRGRHQVENAAAAIEAAEVLSEQGFKMPRQAIIKGLRDVNWPGRLELIENHPTLLLDGAHNAGGAKCLRAYLDEFWGKPFTLVFGVMADKDIEAMAAELFEVAETIVLTKVNDRRAADNARMGKPAMGSSHNVVFTENATQALSWAHSMTPREGLICVAGSLHLVGEIKSFIEKKNDSPVI